MRNQADLRSEVSAATEREKALKTQVGDLEEQLRDTIFHFESQIKILQEGAQGGESAATRTRSSRRRAEPHRSLRCLR